MSESQIKQQRLNDFLDRHALDGVLLQTRANFAWITCGRDNHIANNSPVGVAAIIATRDGKRVCFTNSIEAPRFAHEELAGTGIDVISHLWCDAKDERAKLRELIAGRKISADSETNFPHADFAQLRFSLTDDELERYRDGGERASRAIERACHQIKPGMTEHEIAGVLDHEVHCVGCNPLVTLVAVDDRIEKFRHPIPTEARVQRYAMLVTCSELAGLISSITRFVHFGAISEDLKRRHQAVCNIDAAVNLSTQPGKTLGEMFAVLQRAYADNGFADEWKRHHQGGPTGYATRDFLVYPGMTETVLDRQAFAWNPSITGTKSEDTILCTSNGIEVVTAKSGDWPTVVGRFGDQSLERAGILSV